MSPDGLGATVNAATTPPCGAYTIDHASPPSRLWNTPLFVAA